MALVVNILYCNLSDLMAVSVNLVIMYSQYDHEMCLTDIIV